MMLLALKERIKQNVEIFISSGRRTTHVRTNPEWRHSNIRKEELTQEPDSGLSMKVCHQVSGSGCSCIVDEMEGRWRVVTKPLL
jgi:hypothetical protein